MKSIQVTKTVCSRSKHICTCIMKLLSCIQILKQCHRYHHPHRHGHPRVSLRDSSNHCHSIYKEVYMVRHSLNSCIDQCIQLCSHTSSALARLWVLADLGISRDSRLPFLDSIDFGQVEVVVGSLSRMICRALPCDLHVQYVASVWNELAEASHLRGSLF